MTAPQPWPEPLDDARSHIPADAAAPTVTTCADLDAELLWQVPARADAILDAVASGAAHDVELAGLIGYLRHVVLARVGQHDAHVLPAMRAAGPAGAAAAAVLRAQHLALKESIEDVVEAASVTAGAAAPMVRRSVVELVSRLDTHLLTEAAAVAAHGGRAAEPCGTAWADAVRWYPMVEGATVDMDRLGCPEAQAAVLARLEFLRPGQMVELRGHGDCSQVTRRLNRRWPGRFAWSRSQLTAPAEWVVTVRCR